MMEEVGAFPHNLSNSSPVVHGNLIYVMTSNGQDESHVNIPSPKAPAIIALDKNTGKLVWEDNSVFDKILHGQWSSPTVGTIGGQVQVVNAQGDGWIRGYEATTGKKLWEFDTNPKDSVWPKTRNEVISTPVVVGDVVYISNGQDPEHGEGVGHAYAIDATKRGDITTSGRLWHYDKIRRSVSTPAISDGLIYWPDFSGFLHCLDQKTGQAYWTHDMFAAIWGSPMVADGKVYLGDEDGDVAVLQPGKTLKVLGGEQHGLVGLLEPGGHQRHAVHQQPQPAVRARARRRVGVRTGASAYIGVPGRAGTLAVSGPFVIEADMRKRRRRAAGERFVGGVSSLALVVTLAIVGCDRGAAPADGRYLVDRQLRLTSARGLRLCVAVDPRDPHGVWWWQPGASGCTSRSTGPTCLPRRPGHRSRPLPGPKSRRSRFGWGCTPARLRSSTFGWPSRTAACARSTPGTRSRCSAGTISISPEKPCRTVTRSRLRGRG